MTETLHARPAKFTDPERTAKGEARAKVAVKRLDTLWFNTGTLCNIACTGCYIESSPLNDRLVYLDAEDQRPHLDALGRLGYAPIEIGYTGGEPFLNPHMLELAEAALARGHKVLILTNAMRPMRRPDVAEGLLALRARYPDRLALRVSLDSHDASRHDEERGKGSFAAAREGLMWLARSGFRVSVAGRAGFHESLDEARAGFRRLFGALGLDLDPDDPRDLVLFPEMDPAQDAPEITTACWSLLDKNPDDVMCATSRMVVKRKGDARAHVVSCTLLPYDPQFDLGPDLEAALRPVALNHPYCAQFCVMGGASCSRA